MSVTDVSAHSLGVSVFEGAGGRRRLEVLLGRNTPLPDERSQTFYTMHAGDTQIVVPILEAKDPTPTTAYALARSSSRPSTGPAGPSTGHRHDVLRPRRHIEGVGP